MRHIVSIIIIIIGINQLVKPALRYSVEKHNYVFAYKKHTLTLPESKWKYDHGRLYNVMINDSAVVYNEYRWINKSVLFSRKQFSYLYKERDEVAAYYLDVLSNTLVVSISSGYDGCTVYCANIMKRNKTIKLFGSPYAIKSVVAYKNLIHYVDCMGNAYEFNMHQKEPPVKFSDKFIAQNESFYIGQWVITRGTSTTFESLTNRNRLFIPAYVEYNPNAPWINKFIIYQKHGNKHHVFDRIIFYAFDNLFGAVDTIGTIFNTDNDTIDVDNCVLDKDGNIFITISFYKNNTWSGLYLYTKRGNQELKSQIKERETLINIF
jgi:hypothetical protein